MKYIQISLLLCVIGSFGGYECGDATITQALTNAVIFFSLFVLTLVIKKAQKKAAVKAASKRIKDKLYFYYNR